VRIRLLGALAAMVSAAVHLYLWFDGVKDQGTVGALFVVNVVAGVTIAVLLVRWRHMPRSRRGTGGIICGLDRSAAATPETTDGVLAGSGRRRPST
jgi:hypothetical protein